MDFSNSQLLLAHEFIEKTNQHVFLTGKAGTGKTTFLKNLREKTFKRTVVVAPTGVAAINAGGVTIHSFFQLSFGPQLPLNSVNGEYGIKKLNRERINIIKSLDLLVIDEISMVRADILDAIDDVLRRFRNSDKPFGGVQLLMIGDIHQLAPVVKDDEWNLLRKYYNTMYFFGSKALNEAGYISVELNFIYRQSDQLFIDLLNKIRENKLDADAIEVLNQRYIHGFNPPDDKGYIILTTHNQTANSINAQKLDQLREKSFTVKAAVKDDFPELIYPTAELLELKKGAQVMFVKNDSSAEKRYYNGKIGIVQRFDDDIIYVRCPSDSEEIAVEREEWQNMKYSLNEQTKEISETIIGSFSQYPLKLAWAITIHKSQGLTFDYAIIDAQSSFAHGQVYVALSRCRTLEGLVLRTPILERSIINDSSILSFTQQIATNPPTKEKLEISKLQFQQALIGEIFDFKKILQPYFYSLKIAKENEIPLGGEAYKVLLNIYNQVKLEISEVSDKFQRQLKQLFSQSGEIEDNPAVQERIQKACGYFREKLKNIFVEKLNEINPESDNKAVLKTFEDSLDRLRKEINKKLKTLCSCEQGFRVNNYLKERALSSIEEEPLKSKKSVKRPGKGEHAELYDAIKTWRDEKAIEYNVPEYQVLPKKTIEELVARMPSELKELKNIKGIGKIKQKKFGTELLEIIAQYCKEKNIDYKVSLLEEDTQHKKENTKQITFSLYKSGKSIEEIANERALSVGTIEGHLAHFIAAGEISIHDFVDEYKIKLISSFYEQYQGGTLSEAKAALTDDIEWSELKMVVSHLEYLKNNQQ